MCSFDSKARVLNSSWLRFLMVAGCLACFALPAQAGKPNDITDAENAMVPSYCRDTMGFAGYGDASHNTSPRANHWIALMGTNFWNMHHYCWAHINRMRAMRSGIRPEIRRGLLESVIGDYTYAIDKAPKDFVLAPEILTRLGEVYLMLGRPEPANKSFADARGRKPDYWPAYSRWAEYLISSGKKAEAKTLVKSGLEYTPGARALQDQYRSLGGKLSEIVPKPLAKNDQDEPAAVEAEAKGAPVESGPASETSAASGKGM